MAAIDASESDKDTVSAAALVGAMKSCEGGETDEEAKSEGDAVEKDEGGETDA